MQKKRKQTLTADDEPESKINKMESAAADAPQGTFMEIPFVYLCLSGIFCSRDDMDLDFYE